jgi:hypothetical protein
MKKLISIIFIILVVTTSNAQRHDYKIYGKGSGTPGDVVKITPLTEYLDLCITEGHVYIYDKVYRDIACYSRTDYVENNKKYTDFIAMDDAGLRCRITVHEYYDGSFDLYLYYKDVVYIYKVE